MTWEVKDLQLSSLATLNAFRLSFSPYVVWRLVVIVSCFIFNDYMIGVRMALDHCLTLPSKLSI